MIGSAYIDREQKHKMCVIRYTMSDLQRFKLAKRNQNRIINLALRKYKNTKCPFCGSVGDHTLGECLQQSKDWRQ